MAILSVVAALCSVSSTAWAQRDPVETPTASLLIAAQRGHLAVVRSLLSRGHDPDPRDWRERTALMLAAAGGYLEVARLLLTHGARLNARDCASRTPLIAAASNGRAAVVRLLAAKRAKLEARDFMGATALLYAASDGRVRVIRALLKNGANPDAQNLAGQTALMYAVSRGHAAAARVLLEAGADPGVADTSGRIALDYSHDRTMTSLLQETPAASERTPAARSTPLRPALAQGYEGCWQATIGKPDTRIHLGGPPAGPWRPVRYGWCFARSKSGGFVVFPLGSEAGAGKEKRWARIASRNPVAIRLSSSVNLGGTIVNSTNDIACRLSADGKTLLARAVRVERCMCMPLCGGKWWRATWHARFHRVRPGEIEEPAAPRGGVRN